MVEYVDIVLMYIWICGMLLGKQKCLFLPRICKEMAELVHLFVLLLYGK